MTTARITRGLRWVLGVIGTVMVSLSVFGIADTSEPMVFGAMGIFMAATNFCRQCPLLSALKRLAGRKRPVIPTERL